MPAQPIYEVLAQAFLHEHVDTCFALLGDANMNWANAMHAAGCNFIYVRHEHCAVAAAMGWSRLQNRIGVASVTCGPGLTQIMTALPAAVRANIPLVIFAGEAPLRSAWYNQAIDQRPFVEATGASYRSLHKVENLIEDVRNAFGEAREHQKPVVIGVPLDLQNQKHTMQLHFPPPHQTSDISKIVTPASEQITAIAQRVLSAEKIIIMAGRGVLLSDAAQACTALAAETNAMLATTLPARGLFKDHPFNLGVAGGFSSSTTRRVFQQSDLIIAIGTRLAHHNSDAGKLFSPDKVIHLDLHPRKQSQGRTASQIQLTCDAKRGVNALLAEIHRVRTQTAVEFPAHQNKDNLWRTSALEHEIATAPPDDTVFERSDKYLDPRDVVKALDQLLPQNWTSVNSSGHCSYFFAHMPRRPVEHFITIREFGAIGNGIAFAMGAAVARPEQPVVLFDGDGSLLMHIQELETLVRHKLKLLICVLNDGAYGSEIHKLRAEGLSDAGAVFGRRNFAKVATGFDAEGLVFEDLQPLEEALDKFKQTQSTTIWDFHVSDKIVSPVVQRSHGLKT